MPLRLWARRRAAAGASLGRAPAAKAEKSGGATVEVLFGALLRWSGLGKSATRARFAIARPAGCAGERKRNAQGARFISALIAVPQPDENVFFCLSSM